MARLRRLLAEGGSPEESRLRAAPSGYLLEVREGELDLKVFGRHHLAARQAHRDADWPEVLRECGAGLALWRGDALSDVPLLSDQLRNLVTHLTEGRLLTLEWRFDAELALGRHQGLAAELTELAAAHPLRETFHRQLMLALHRTHRQAEALAAFHTLRRTLVDELGVEPGPAVQAVYQEILANPLPDAAAAPPDPPRTRPTPAQLPADTADFTGRAAALAILVEALREPASARGGPSRRPAAPRPGRPPGRPDRRSHRVAPPGAAPLVRRPPGRRASWSSPAWAASARPPSRCGPHTCSRRTSPTGSCTPTCAASARAAPGGPATCWPASSVTSGRPASRCPEDPDDRAVLWRDAVHGRRVLLVLDNAADAAQVVPLLPGGGGSAVVVTSRRTLADLPGAVRLPLEPMTAAEQRQLLVTVCGERRVAAEPEAAAGVLAACGGLPLALRIAGARMTARPNWPLTALAERLDGADGSRLHALSAGGLAVRDTFAMSYVAMRDSPLEQERTAARAFCLLGVWPEHALSPASAAALLGPGLTAPPPPASEPGATGAVPGGGPAPAAAVPAVSAPLSGAEAAHAVEDVLEALVDAHLLQTPWPGGYTFHDLLGQYATGCAEAVLTPAERQAAVRRLTVWYAATLASTAAVLTPEAHPIPPLPDQPAAAAMEFATDEAAMRWCVRELPAIREALRQAVAYGWPDLAWRLAAGLFGYAQMYWWNGEWTTCLEEAMACVIRHGDVLGRAWMHSRLGVAYGMADRHDVSLEQLHAAQDYFKAAGDLRGQAAILTNLTALYRCMGEYEQALDHGRQSLALHRALGDDDRVATVLGNLGDSHLFAGHPVAAEACFREALATWRSRGSTVAIARTLTSLGESLLALGRPAQARETLEENLVLLDRLGDRATASDVLEVLGRAHFAGGDRVAARRCWEEAVELARVHHLPAWEEAALKSLARLELMEAGTAAGLWAGTAGFPGSTHG